jgi:hypothetical protein
VQKFLAHFVYDKDFKHMKINTLYILLFISTIGMSGQTKTDTKLDNFWDGYVTIYEYGAPLTSCETNFKNLLENWHTANITNANEYKFVDISFVESISDSIKYRYYRNYFSGGEPVFSSIQTNRGEGPNRKEIYRLYVAPGYIHQELYDRRLLPEQSKKIFSKEFMQQAQGILELEINIDTLSLVLFSGEIFKIDTIETGSDFWGNYVQKSHGVFNLASTDSISKEYIDISIKREKDSEDLNMQERRALVLEGLLIERISNQVLFNNQVHIGDKVFSIQFIYRGTTYTDYVICNPDNKKVVIDSFFKNITIDTKRYPLAE